MIRIKNTAQQTLVLKVPGIATAAANKDSILIPFDGFISNIVACCASGGTGATNSILDVNYIGSTIFGTDAVKVTIASTTGVATYGAVSSPFSVTFGAILSVDVDSISTNLSGTSIMVTISKTPPSSVTNLTDMNIII